MAPIDPIAIDQTETPWIRTRVKWFKLTDNNVLIWPFQFAYKKHRRTFRGAWDQNHMHIETFWICEKEYIMLKLKGKD